MPRHLWVVEMLLSKGWEATVGARLDREEGRKELKRWKGYNPSDRFRLKKYVPAEPRP